MTSDDDQFVELLTSNLVRLRGYAFALLRDQNNVDDVLQNTWMTLWRKREQYDTERDFFRWACGITHIEILRFRRKRATDKLQFSEALMLSLSEEYIVQIEASDARRNALPLCLAELPAVDRQLIESRYKQGEKVESLATELKRPLSTVYRKLAHVRTKLRECITQRIQKELA